MFLEPVAESPDVSTPAPPAATPSPLERFRLQQYPWTEPLIDAAKGLLNLNANGTVVPLKLSEDDVSRDRIGFVRTWIRCHDMMVDYSL